MNKYELINRMIIDIDHLSVQGVANMGIVLRTIENLKALGDMLQKEESGDKPKLEVVKDEQNPAD